MRQAHMQQLEYQNGSYSKSMQSQLSPAGHSGSSRQHSNAHYQQHLYHSNSGSRNHRFSEEPGPSRHQQSGHGRDNYSHQGDRSSNRQQQSRGSYRPQDNKGGSGHSDNRWRRYWHTSRGRGGLCKDWSSPQISQRRRGNMSLNSALTRSGCLYTIPLRFRTVCLRRCIFLFVNF